MINTVEIGKAIRAYCDATGRTNADLARDLKVDKSTVGRWIDGKAREIKPIHWVALKGMLKSHLADNALEGKSLEEIVIEDAGLSSSAKLKIVDIIRKDRARIMEPKDRKG